MKTPDQRAKRLARDRESKLKVEQQKLQENVKNDCVGNHGT